MKISTKFGFKILQILIAVAEIKRKKNLKKKQQQQLYCIEFLLKIIRTLSILPKPQMMTFPFFIIFSLRLFHIDTLTLKANVMYTTQRVLSEGKKYFPFHRKYIRISFHSYFNRN